MIDNQPQKRFNLHLPGLLEVLAGSLYSSSKVGLRELIQNAHDSCLRRMIEGGEQGYRARIQITSDAEQGTLTISDNGYGLLAAEIDEYLATIGRSYTGELKDELGLFSPDEAAKLIGQFGFGFLSAFLLASEVTLITRSFQPGGEALRWHSAGGEFYTVQPATRDRVGTTVILQLKPGLAYLLEERVLRETVQKYADFLSVPIYLNQEPSPVNLMRPPWEALEPHSAMLAYIARAFQVVEEPLCVFQLTDQSVDLGHDTFELPLQGFLFVPASSTVSVREYGDLTVFIRRMFICENETKLLPSWARFVRGVIDCPYLQPTASREAIHEDDMFVAVQRALENQLKQALYRTAQEEPAVWRQIVQGHTDVITGWAVRDDKFFEMVANLVTFRTSRGYLTLPEYLQLTGNKFYYLTKRLGSLQAQLLAEGSGAPLIDAHWFAVKPFLEKYTAWHDMEIELIQMDGEVKQLLQPVSDLSEFMYILAFYRRQGIPTQVVNFNPREVPALMVYPEDTEFFIEARQALDQQELPDPLAGLMADYLEKKINPDELQGTLYLNGSCHFVRKLAEATVSEAIFEAALTLIYQIARLFAGRALTTVDITGAFRETVEAMEMLIQDE